MIKKSEGAIKRELHHKRIIQKRKDRERNQRIEAILEAAKKLFQNKGYIKATMDEIALEAEISKPTIYQYYKTKDDLYFTLMLPVLDDIGFRLTRIHKRILDSKYEKGSELAKDIFAAYYETYQNAPELFRIVQLFQQSGIVWELNKEVLEALFSKARYNFNIARQIMTEAIRRDFFRKADPYELVDVLWGLISGIIELEDVKSSRKKENKYLKPTLHLAEKIFIGGICTDA